MKNKKPLPTQFAPAERAAAQTIREQADFIAQLDLMDPLLNAVPEGVVVLNSERQIVYANTPFREAVGGQEQETILGRRPGEALLCEYALSDPGGCGTSEACRHCGAVLSILTAQKGKKNSQECRISVRDGAEIQALDFRVTATPFTLGAEQYVIFAATDISDEKRRSVLERIFFHDITNTAGAILGLAKLLADAKDLDELHAFGFNALLSQASAQLIDEIQAQRQIMAAERGELEARPQLLKTHYFLDKLVIMYRNHQVSDGKQLVVAPQFDDVLFESDDALLGRVLGNMIKNALEASAPGETVTVGCEQIYDYVRFWIHNPRPISPQVQLQLFKRSFSTKGRGRGLGTYSMKMLSENFLQGRVSFETGEKTGTTFMGMYPLKWPQALPAT